MPNRTTREEVELALDYMVENLSYTDTRQKRERLKAMYMQAFDDLHKGEPNA